jgi:hypothetical protein
MSKTVTIQAQQKWENCVLTRKTETTLIHDADALGQEGWEMISVLYYKDMKGAMAWTAFMKRPSTGDASRPAAPAAAGLLNAAAGRGQAAAGPAAAGPQGFDLSDEDFKMEE